MTATRATFVGYRPLPSRGVGILTFEVPLEGLDAAVRALGGTPLPQNSTWVAIARLTNEAAAAEAPPTPPAAAKPTHPLVKRAGMLANNPGFQKWAGCADAESAAAFIRTRCQVSTRRQLAYLTEAARSFEAVEAEYLASQYPANLTGRK